MSRPVPDFLAKQNVHPRDKYITFDEGPHIYTVHGKQGFTSVTTWNHSHFAHFDADGIIDKIVKSPRMHSVTNFFIANLAVADFIIGIFAIPFQVYMTK